jgi:polar amino acid transport system substrate-binding protein
LLPALSACSKGDGNPESPQAIRARGVLRVAVFIDKPPFSYIDATGKQQGYDAELARRLAKDLLGDASKVVFVPSTAGERITLLEEGKADIVAANFTNTPERAQRVDFSLPYMRTALGLISPRQAPIRKMSDLKAGEKVCVDAGTTAEAYFRVQFPKIPLLGKKTNREAFRALQNHECVALAHDDTLLYAWVRKHPEYTIGVHPLGPPQMIAPAVQKGDAALLAWLDTEMRKLYAEGFFFEAYDRTIRPFYGDEINPLQVVVSR